MNKTDDGDHFRVLFVCTGNICRSPMAEGVFAARAAERGMAAGIEADSAGISGYHVGEAPRSARGTCPIPITAATTGSTGSST